ncbi:hypothetical protein D3C87_1843770 [compost metagenome]
MVEITKEEFDIEENFNGYELIFENTDSSFQVGYHRQTKEAMFGRIHIVGTPVKSF